MQARFYTTSYKAWDGMFKAMSAAQESIYMEMYIFLADTRKTHDFVSLLREKSRAGVEVVIVADALGSFNLPSSSVEELREAGAEFIYFSHWLRRTHRKILIIDRQLAFIGGVNIKERDRDWIDLQIRVSGPIVKALLKTFANNYLRVGGRKESIAKYSRLPLAKKIKSWVIDNIPGADSLYNINSYYREKIGGAKQSIRIVTPYLLPPRWLLAVLDEACRRGVLVEVIIPNDTDVKILNRVNYLNACRLAAVGVKFYLAPLMNHAKIMIVDDEEGVVGSQNIDILSFGLNMEAGVFFRQKKLVEDVLAIFKRWQASAVPFNMTPRPVSLADRLAIGFLKVFYTIF